MGSSFSRLSLEKIFTRIFSLSPSRFFSTKLQYDGEVFGFVGELQGIGWVKLQGYSKVKIRKEKRPYIVQNGRCKVLNSYLLLGFQRMPNFAFFKGSDDAEISQKQGHPDLLNGLTSQQQFDIIFCIMLVIQDSLVAQMAKTLPVMQKTWV